MNENSFSVQKKIFASPAVVWSVLADIGSIADWHPGLVASRPTSDRTAGLGATRHCDLGGRSFLDEEVVAWEPERRLTMRIIDTNLPLTADIRFTLQPDADGTIVTVSPLYQVKYGWIGRLLDRFVVRNNYEKGMHVLLKGLKKQAEAIVDNTG